MLGNRDLKRGMRGGDVADLQRRLTLLVIAVGPVDGIFGPKTEQAVIHFQLSRRLPATGIANAATIKALLDITGETAVPRIEIDVTHKKLTLFIGEKMFGVYPVAVGKPATPSPIGHWLVKNKWLHPGGPFGTRWMGLNVPWGSYGIHGTNNPASIGNAVSHGCIRMHNKDVEVIYPLLPIGTAVNVVGSY
ncbi:L,D-transpeptidase family protein [Metallumcola ferriviriculae]|uniref:L,D-transpeptidase family protein n=1 Tax=Metallumcola ferriviriculae TaxID=3039180 RepID=A0AAU0UIA6_9FIRM|nr:L,D-transpeptidase family protein [Desulfitibacteraceae bacterium MK1]